jgi:hypothetical protein
MGTMTARREHAVRYVREGSEFRKVRIFQSRQGAERFLDRLLGDGRRDLAPLITVTVEARDVGPWDVDEVIR